MPIDELQHAVATVALRAAARHGFALAGGNALIAHGIVDRPTDDVDLFSNQQAGVSAAAEVVQDALRAAGFQADRQDTDRGLADVFYGMGDGIAEWIITAPGGQQTMLQLAYFDRSHRPVTMDVGPVLALEDLAGCEGVRAGQPGRAARLHRHRRGDAPLSGGPADRLRRNGWIPAWRTATSPTPGRQLDRMPDGVFARYGLGPQDVARLRARFADWPRP